MGSPNDDLLAEGLQRFQVGDLEGAQRLLLEIPADSPRRGEAMLALGRMLLDTGHVEESVACLVEASLLLREPRSFKELADCFLLLERYREAEVALREAVQRDPDDPECWAMLGRACVALDRLEEGIGALERAVLLDGAFAPARYYLADALIRAGDTVRASGQLHMLLSLEPQHLGAVVIKGDLAFQHGEVRQAIAEYRRAAALGALPASGYVRLGTACERVGDEAGAVEAYDRALALQPGLPDACLAAGRLCERRKLFRRARRYYRAIVAPDRHGSEIADALGRIDAYLRHFDLSGQGNVPEDDDDEPLDGLPRGLDAGKPGPPTPPGRFGRGRT